MSKPVKQMIVKQYQDRFRDVEGAVVVDLRGYNATDNNQLRNHLRKKGVRVTIVKNTLARQAIAGTPLEAIGPALVGPAAFCYGAESVVNVARDIIEWSKKVKEVALKAAVLDGTLFDGPAGVRRLSEFPTREEAQGRVVAIALAPAGKLVAAAKAPGANILGIVKSIEEKLEKGESISRVA
ncbi:MAG TPA: 50S ribosomal protein L10 [Phycisphaerales bacterium]|nr:50S ribosomal protein L10 [Phycisphaerales bacterium]HMP38701.1 50S ribosomal protein L10 [Phycisphaerales bacterium]